MGFRLTCTFDLNTIYTSMSEINFHFNCENLEIGEDGTQILFFHQTGSYVSFQFVCLHLTLANSKGKSQSSAHFNCEYLGNDDRSGKHYYYHQI